jgi:hypothetical protein
MEFLRAVRPLSDDLHERVRESLFAGVKQPFHYLRNTGWMRHLLREGDRLPPEAVSLEQWASHLGKRLPWQPSDVVILVYQPATYATTWERFLHYLRAGFLNLDTLLVCHPRKREVAMFWEGYAPTFGKRGHRELPQPRLAATDEA